MTTKSSKPKKSMFNAPVYGKILYDPRTAKKNKAPAKGKKK